MKRVLLVNTNTERMPYPVPPLGLCLLAGVLEKKYEVRIYDGVFDEGKSLPAWVSGFRPDYIGCSIRNIDDVVADRTIFYPDIILSNFIRPLKAISDVPIILGGSGFSMFPGELMAMMEADYGIAGEGEHALPVLLDFLDRGEEPFGITGLWSKGGPCPTVRKPQLFVDYRRPVFAEIDRHIDFSPYRQRGVYSIQTRRGCAVGCIYCSYPMIEGRRYRLRDPEEIAREIVEASGRLGEVVFEFVDSTFNDPPGHAEGICEAIIKSGVKARFRTMGINPRYVSERLFGLMKEAGFTQIDATPDSASPGIIKNLHKGFTLREVQNTARLIKKFDLPTMWFFLFGGPGETEETFWETMRFIDDFIAPDDLVYLSAGMRIYPGTPLEKIAIREGIIREGFSLFQPSTFYFSPLLGRRRLSELVEEAAAARVNCIPAANTAPDPQMLKEAVALRTSMGLNEPMFRSLLRVRRDWKAQGRL